MLSYPEATDYRDAIRLASTDERWSAAERRHLATIADDDENTGTVVGTGRTFRDGRMQFHAHIATKGVNVGRAR